MRFANVLAILMVSVIVWGCNKKEFSPIPVIGFLSQTTTMVADSGKGEQIIMFEFNFQDGDSDIGPIGSPNPRFPPNIFFTDQRDPTKIQQFAFPPIPTDVVQRDGIKGTFEVFMQPNVLIARDDTTVHKFTDTVIYEVYVVDEAGNSSNTVQTRPIVIKK